MRLDFDETIPPGPHRMRNVKNDQLPEGFLAQREDGTVRVHLPEVEVTASHVFEPMLTRGVAQRLAEALWEADVDTPVERVILLRGPQLSAASVEKFRERLLALLIEGGMETEVEVEVERDAATSVAPPAPAPAAEAPAPAPRPSPPVAEPPSPPPPAPAKKAFVAPVPARRKVGGARTPADEGAG